MPQGDSRHGADDLLQSCHPLPLETMPQIDTYHDLLKTYYLLSGIIMPQMDSYHGERGLRGAYRPLWPVEYGICQTHYQPPPVVVSQVATHQNGYHLRADRVWEATESVTKVEADAGAPELAPGEPDPARCLRIDREDSSSRSGDHCQARRAGTYACKIPSCEQFEIQVQYCRLRSSFPSGQSCMEMC
jgi:hypothetical protein